MSGYSLSSKYSRRDFLKLGSLGFAGAVLFPTVRSLPGSLQADPIQYGRVIDPSLALYPTPSFSEKALKYVWKDLVLPINSVTVGDNDPPYNRIWYQLGDQGYAHSGSVQPVRIELNQPSPSLPDKGQLAAVTVPYTDARYSPSVSDEVIYRLYYQTTHWVSTVHSDDQGESWYGLLDDKLKSIYFVLARHLHLISPKELQPISPAVPLEDKRIEVLLGHQAIVAYERDRPVFMARTATGARFSSGNYSTEPGRYIINRKRPSRHMAAGDHAAPNSFDLPGVPWICYFTEDGISLHGTYWHNDFGKTRSHGCVNLSPTAARWIYLWTLPSVPSGEQSVFETTGTVVDVI